MSKYLLIKNRSGIISAYVLLLLLLFLTISVTILQVEEGGIRSISGLHTDTQARLLAESALDEARYYLENIDNTWTGDSNEQVVSIGGSTIGSYEFTVSKSGNRYTINATGYVPNKTNPESSYSLSFERLYPNPYVIFYDTFETNNLNKWDGEDNDSNADWDTTNADPNNGTYHAVAESSKSNRWAKLFTPTFDLSPYESVVLRFSLKKKGNPDTFRIYQNSTGQAGDWDLIYTAGNNVSTSSYTRPAESVSISNLSATVQFRIEGKMDNNEKWYVDDLVLSTPYVVHDPTVDENP